jgi:hypothetical protein
MQPSNLFRATAFAACLVLSAGTAFAAHGSGSGFGGGGLGRRGFSHGLAGDFYGRGLGYGEWYWYDPYWAYEECDYPFAYGYAEQCYYGLEYPGYGYGYQYPDGQYYGHHRRMHAYEKRRGRAAEKKLSRLQGAPLGRRTRSIDFY